MRELSIDLVKAAYKLQGRMKFQGLKISIENRKGSVRRGVDKDGHKWATKMTYAYGYIRMSDEVRRKGADGDHVDCFIGPSRGSERVFVVHLNHADTGTFDEDKVFLGFDSAKEAKAAFNANYDAAGRKLFGGMTEMNMSHFKQRLGVQSKGVIKSLGNKAVKGPLLVCCCDLEKALRKAHFRRDPKTGKLIYVHEHTLKDGKGHDHEVESGKKMRVNNPRSKHHGKTVEVKSYNHKYDSVYVNIEGQNHPGDFRPDHLEHVKAEPSKVVRRRPVLKRTPVVDTKKDPWDDFDTSAKKKPIGGDKTPAAPGAYDFQGAYDTFLAANSFTGFKWDKAKADKGWVRYYLKDGYKDLGFIQVVDATGEVASVGAKTTVDPKVVEFFKVMKKTWRAKTGEKLSLETAFADAGIALKTFADGSYTLSGNTYEHKNLIANVGGKWDHTFKRYNLPMTVDLYDLLKRIPPYYTKEDIDGRDAGSDKHHSIGARPGRPMSGADEPDSVPVRDGAADGGRDSGGSSAGTGKSSGASAADSGAAGRRRKVRGLERYTIKELTELIHKTGIKSPEPSVKLDPNIIKKLTLYDKQIEGAEAICSTFEDKGSSGFLLGDDTGTGKTYTAAAVMAQRKVKRGIIVCPNDGVCKQWMEVLEKAGLNAVRAEGTKKRFVDTDGILVTTYATFRQNPTLHLYSRDMAVFDEAHSMKHLAEGETAQATAGYTLVQEQMRNKKKVLYLTATPYEKPQQAKIYEALGLWAPGHFDDWVQKRGVKIEWDEIPTKYGVKKIKSYSLVGNGSAAVKATLIDHIDMVTGGLFLARENLPEGVNLTNHFEMGSMTPQQKKTYDSIRGFFDKVAGNTRGIKKAQVKNQQLFWSRRFMESVKLPAAIELTKKAVGDGKKVAIMVGYKSKSDVTDQIAKMWGIVKTVHGIPTKEFQQFEREMVSLGGKIEGTLHSLKAAFPDAVEYHGDISAADREKGKKEFNTGKAQVMIATQQSADTGLSLHDTVGDAPRYQINVTMPWSGTSMKQLAGRCHRLGSKSDTDLVWLFTNSKDEKRRAELVSTKMRLLGAGTKGLDVTENDELYKRLAEFMMGTDSGDGLKKALTAMDLLHVIALTSKPIFMSKG